MSVTRRLSLSLLVAVLTACGAEDQSTEPTARDNDFAANGVSTCPPVCVGPIWTKQILGTLPGTSFPTATDVSDNGTIVGGAQKTSNGHVVPFVWTASGGMKRLPVPGGLIDGYANAVSDNGTYAVGQAYVLVQGSYVPVPLLWDLAGPTVRQFITHCTGSSVVAGYADGINNVGTAVGHVGGAQSGSAVFWTNTTSCPAGIPLTTLSSVATGINNAGDIVGDLGNGSSGFFYNYHSPVQAYLLTGGAATAINNGGKAVGNGSFHCQGNAVSWNAGAHNAKPLGAQSSCGVAISDKGRTVWTASSGPAMTLYKGTLKSLPLLPFGVNLCGDIVGYEGADAVLYKKVTCD